ncbi:GAF domain-containing protein [Sphingomonas sp. PsM26]|nr:GAF domain-containing protein [Sphingomonas sp. PsM26]
MSLCHSECMTFTTSLSDAAETSRLAALWNMAILDTPTQRDFDEVTRLAALALGSESAAVSLVDDRRAWFKSRVCIPAAEAPREHAFCTLALESAEPVVILDTHADVRCEGNPLTLGPDGFRFYAGAPIITSDGHCLGTLCVLDRQPRAEVPPEQLRALADLAGIVIGLIEARRYRQIGEIATQVVDVTSDAISTYSRRSRPRASWVPIASCPASGPRSRRQWCIWVSNSTSCRKRRSPTRWRSHFSVLGERSSARPSRRAERHGPYPHPQTRPCAARQHPGRYS